MAEKTSSKAIIVVGILVAIGFAYLMFNPGASDSPTNVAVEVRIGSFFHGGRLRSLYGCESPGTLRESIRRRDDGFLRDL